MIFTTSGALLTYFFMDFLRFVRWRAATTIILISAGTIFDGVGLLLLVPVLDIVTDQPGGGRFSRGWAHPVVGLLNGYGQAERLVALLGAFAVLVALRSAVHARRDQSIARLQLDFSGAMRARLIDQLVAAAWPQVLRVKPARMVQALGVDIPQIGVTANSALLTATALAAMGGYCVLALFLAPLAGSFAIAFGILGAVISRPFMRRAQQIGRSITGSQLGMTESATLFLNGLKLATAQGLQSLFVDEYALASAAAREDRLQFARVQSGLRNLTAALAAAVGAATLLLGVSVFHLPPSILITLLVVLSRMSGPAMSIQNGVGLVLYGLPAYASVLELTQELARTPCAAAARTARAVEAPADSAVIFDEVTFSHAPSAGLAPELERVSLAIPRGAFVGVAGPSGAGKTTFLDLVAGLLSPQSGVVHVDGRREHLAYVAQDPFLFDDTIRRNLAWSRPGCTDAEMEDALDLVGAAPLLRRVEGGLDTRLGERGGLISAGERQRLALARAILRRPTLLILDEATNAIDLASERGVLEGLASLRPRTTILMVAHRRESLVLCDHILTFPGASLSRAPGPAQTAAARRA